MKFRNAIEVVDLGLRLADMQEYGLESEKVAYGKSDPTYNLLENGATREEIRFLYRGGDDWRGHHGSRVELNAFTSDKLVEWIEGKLKQHGVEKVVPPREALELAYRRAVALDFLKRKQQELLKEAEAQALGVRMPGRLVRDIHEILRRDPTLAWDDAVVRLLRG